MLQSIKKWHAVYGMQLNVSPGSAATYFRCRG